MGVKNIKFVFLLFVAGSCLQSQVSLALDLPGSPPVNAPPVSTSRQSKLATSMLWSAAERNDHEGVRDALESFANINGRNDSGFTALHKAAALGHVEAMGVLLIAGANKEITTNIGDRPIHVAAANGRVHAVAVLAMAGAEIQPRGQESMTPLLMAIRNHHNTTANLIRYLSYCSEQKNRPAVKGASSLLITAMAQRDDPRVGAVADAILTGADLETKVYGPGTSVELAIIRDDIEVLSLVLRAGGSNNTRHFGYRPIMQAVGNSRTEAATLMAVSGADLHIQDRPDRVTPLALSDERSKTAVAAVLRSLGAWRFS